MMCNDERALLRGVQDRPEDDLPRLVLADWWEENGRPERAEFVRLQVELASRKWEPTGTEWREYDALRRRGRELFANYGDQFFDNVVQTFGGIEQIGLSVITWSSDEESFPALALIRRGFVESVSCTLAQFVGGPCGRCGGEGELGDAVSVARRYVFTSNFLACPDCKSDPDYRTPGVAPRLFASQPVTRVTLTDRKPYPAQGKFYWSVLTEDDPRAGDSSLPDCFRDMPGFSHGPFDTRNDAKAHLSNIAVAYGRANAEGMSYEVRCDSCSGEGCDFKGHGDPKQFCGGKGTIRRPGLPPLASTAKETVS